MFFELITELTLNNFFVKLYKLNTETNVASIEEINNITSILNSKEYAKDILEEVQKLSGITKIEVFDNNHNILLTCSLFIEA